MAVRASLLATGLALAVVACGGGQPPPREGAPPLTEVASTTLDGVVYTIRGARELDPNDPSDRVYLKGRTPPSDRRLLGVFLALCNAANAPVDTAEEMRLVRRSGPVGSRVSLEANRLAYEARELGDGECAPPGQTLPARVGPGLLVLFEVAEGVLDERALRLEIESAEGEEKGIPVELGNRR